MNYTTIANTFCKKEYSNYLQCNIFNDSGVFISRCKYEKETYNTCFKKHSKLHSKTLTTTDQEQQNKK